MVGSVMRLWYRKLPRKLHFSLLYLRYNTHMRNKGQKKKGALTPAAAEQKASELIAKNGVCLFIMDIVESTNYGTGGDPEVFRLFHSFLEELNKTFPEYLPENTLAIGPSRSEQGFQGGLGDAAWAGINDASVIPKIVALKESAYPELNVYYGVAEDGWDEGMILAK